MTTASNPHVTESPLSSRRYLPWMIVLFVGSGCAALIYEVVWLQLLSLTIGSSGKSLGVLLGTFMGGMCLGSLVLPRLIPARLHPLRVYAVLELLIGIVGIAVLYFIQPLTEWYVQYGSHDVNVRALVAAVCLLPPTLLMGATLPAIARWVEATPQGVSWMGFFYGSNIVGAVIGCLLAGFYLLREYDMPIATYVAAGINLLVAIFAFILAGQTPHVVPDDQEARHEDLGPLVEVARPSRVPYLVIALSGCCALGAEVVWTRLLSLMLGATVYTFSIILAVFLVGLGIGSSVGAAAARSSRNPRAALGWCQLLIAASLAWSGYMISESLPFWPVNPQMNLGTALEHKLPLLNLQLDIVRTAWVVLPGSILWGASFPLALAAVASRGKDPARLVGGVYAANTVGAIVGAVAVSIFLIPAVQSVWTQRILMGLAIVSGLIALLPQLIPAGKRATGDDAMREPTFSIVSIPTALILIGIVGYFMYNLKPIPWSSVAYGRTAASQLASMDLQEPGSETPGTEDSFCLYRGEGMNVSVAVSKSRSSGWMYFHGAGKVQASSDPWDMRLQRMLGHLSVLAHPRPDSVEDVLVVACGAGVTAGSFIPYPHVKNITICDIEPLVPTKVTPQFSAVNYGITDGVDKQNPRNVQGKNVLVAYDDGRHHIKTLPKDKKFDVITSDPIDPWVKGCAALNTVEYYQMCKDHLKPGGVMSLWIPLYESSEETAKSVIATFFQVFPNGVIFSNDERGEGYDAVLFGVNEEGPVKINVDEMQERLNRAEYAAVKQSLLDVKFGAAESRGGNEETGRSIAIDLLATYAGRGEDLAEWGKDAQINLDRNLRLQYLAGSSFNQQIAPKILNGIFKYYKFPEQMFVGSTENISSMRRALEDDGRDRFSRQQVGTAD